MSLPPGPSGTEVVRWIGGIRRNAPRTLDALRHRYGDVAGLPLPGRYLVLVAHPDGVQHVLQGAHTRYGKARTYDVLALLLGEGLLTSEGERWRTHRRLLQPAFHDGALAGLGTMMVRTTQETVEAWPEGAEIDLAARMRDLTLRIVGQALLSEDLTAPAERIGRAMDAAIDYARIRFESLLGPFVTPPSPARARFRRAIAELDGIVRELIRQRRTAHDPPADLLTLLVETRDPAIDERLDDDEVRDEVLTFLAAGHETTAHALAWTLWLLGRHAGPRRRLLTEIGAVLDGRPATAADLADLPYTRAVIEESLRLYPPAWALARTPREPDEIGGFEIPTHAEVMVSQWVTHRHPGVWEHPTAFDPERFLGEPPARRPRFAYFPFGAGPRQCIGAGFAMLEARLLLVTILQRVDLEVVPGFPVELEPGITLRPAHGIRAGVRRH